MIVYAGFECCYNGCDEFRQLHKLFKNELDALRFLRLYQPQKPSGDSINQLSWSNYGTVCSAYCAG